MIEIGNTLVSFDLFDHMFCCDLEVCKGCCCVDGDSGAPLEDAEAEILEQIKEKILHLLPEKSCQTIKERGTSYIDRDGDLVTQLVDDREECVFAYFAADGICLCAIEKAYREGLVDFHKPISCHLYPVRLKKYEHFTALNVHRWSCCKSAEEKGQKLGLPLYKFLKEPLTRRFGEAWYSELEDAAEAYYNEFKSV